MKTLFTFLHIKDQSPWPWEVPFLRLPRAAAKTRVKKLCTNIIHESSFKAHGDDKDGFDDDDNGDNVYDCNVYDDNNDDCNVYDDDNDGCNVYDDDNDGCNVYADNMFMMLVTCSCGGGGRSSSSALSITSEMLRT